MPLISGYAMRIITRISYRPLTHSYAITRRLLPATLIQLWRLSSSAPPLARW